jgi:glycerol-3-phosphate acyltransferase PlsY
MPSTVLTVFAIIASWLIGSIPTAFIVTKVAIGKDIRALGSGNAGATNVFRALGPRYAIPVFLFDFLKGFIPVYAILRGGFVFAVPETRLALVAGAAAVAGHLFPPFIDWRGGKGVATGAGVVTALYPPLFPACLAVFAAVFLATRRMSLASISTAATVPFIYAAMATILGKGIDIPLLAFLTIIAAIVIARHRRNIARLAKGTEERLY